MSTFVPEASPITHIPSLLYAQQPRPMDSEVYAPIRGWEEENQLIKDADDILQKFVDQNLLIPEEYGNKLSSHLRCRPANTDQCRRRDKERNSQQESYLHCLKLFSSIDQLSTRHPEMGGLHPHRG